MRSRQELESGTCEIALTVNGVAHTLRVPPLRRLLDVLREELRLTGSKEGCGEGECGACTVLVDGAATLACLVPMCQLSGTRVTTIESRGYEDLQEAFLAHGGAQCGICTPGMIVMAQAYIDDCERRGAVASSAGARTALAGNLCRCTGYEKILDSVLAAARARRAARGDLR